MFGISTWLFGPWQLQGDPLAKSYAARNWQTNSHQIHTGLYYPPKAAEKLKTDNINHKNVAICIIMCLYIYLSICLYIIYAYIMCVIFPDDVPGLTMDLVMNLSHLWMTLSERSLGKNCVRQNCPQFPRNSSQNRRQQHSDGGHHLQRADDHKTLLISGEIVLGGTGHPLGILTPPDSEAAALVPWQRSRAPPTRQYPAAGALR